MPSKTSLAITCLVVAASLVVVRAEAQTYCLTPTAVPQPPPPPSPPPVCQPRECDKCTKSPCYLATGIYARDAVDLTIPTAGTFSLVASRLYDSSRLADGPVGTGWSSSLTAHLYYATYLLSAPNTYSHEADIVMPDGVLNQFAVDAAGTFYPPFGRFDTLVRNADATYSLTMQHSKTVYRFNTDGSIASLTDDYGNVINWTYDGSARLQRVADTAGSGRYIDVTWGADGRIAMLTDNIGRQVKYYYDTSSGTLTGAADPSVSGNASLRSTNYSYAAGRFGPVLTRIADRWNRVMSDLEWYPDGKLKSYTDGAYNAADPASSTGEKYVYEYHPDAIPHPYTMKTSSLSGQQYQYEATGIVGGQNYTNGLITNDGAFQYEYDGAGRVTRVTAPSGESGYGTMTWWYTYDPAFPEKVSSIIPKDAYNNVKTNWAGWRYDYSETAQSATQRVWRVRSDTTTKDLVATYNYNAHGRLYGTADDNGATTAYGYNEAGDLTSVTTSGHPDATQIAYDAVGRPLSVTDAGGHTTTMTYDAFDRQLSVTRPRPSAAAAYDTVTTFSYDNYDSSTGLTFTVTTDPNGRVTKAGYDAMGHMIQSIDQSGNVTQFIYQYDLLKTIRDANGNETSYGYNVVRELASTTFPDGAIESYNVSSGVLGSRTDRRGNTIQYTYDPLGRLYSALCQGVGQTYQYDGQKLTYINDYTAAGLVLHNYAYDSSWRLITDDTLTGTEKKTYDYSGATGGQSAGSLLTSYKIEPHSGTSGTTQTVSYTYDAAGRVTGQTWSWLPYTPFTFEYTPTGQYSRFVFPNGQQRRLSYDNQDRLTNITNESPSGNTIASFDYAYDYDWQTSTYSMLGQRTSVAVTAPGAANIVSGLTKYSYDANYQLVRVDYPSNGYDGWTYDAIGNRVGRHHPIYGWAVPYTYFTNASGANTQRLRNDGYFELSYDAAGNVTGAATQYSSDPYTWDYAGRLTSYGGKTYTYDVFGRTSRTASGSTTRYISMSGNTVGERNTATGVATDYIFGPGIDEPLAKRTANASISYFGVDGLGSLVVSTDTAGTVLSSSGYSPWGEVSVPLGPELFGYTGRETGGPSWYYRARHYDAAHGRFLSEDPIGLPLDINRYRYVLNNPLSYVDPFGEQESPVGVATIGAGIVVTAIVGITIYDYMRSHPEMYDIFRPPPPLSQPMPFPPSSAVGPRDRPVQPGRDEPRPGEQYHYPPNACPIPTAAPVTPRPSGPCDYPNGQWWRWAAAAPTRSERLMRSVVAAWACYHERS